MDKNILREYVDACELIKETEEDIRAIKRKRKTVIADSVKGSSKGFPYTEQTFKIQGIAHSVLGHPHGLERQERILEERKAKAEQVKAEVEGWLNTIPLRMQRIVRMRVFEGKTWDAISGKMGRGATADSVRKEFRRFVGKDF